MKLLFVCCWLKLSVLEVGAAGFLPLDVAVTAAGDEVILGGSVAFVERLKEDGAPEQRGALLEDLLGILAEYGSLSEEFTNRIRRIIPGL